LEQRTSARAYFFLCEGNVLLFSHRLEGSTNVLAELESGDAFTAAPYDSPSLTKVLNAYPGFQKTFSVRTSGPVEYVLLNEKYLLLLNIQASANMAGNFSGSLMTVYLTGDDYIDRTDNILKMIREIPAGGLKGDYSPLHGTGAMTSGINAYVSVIVNFLAPVLLIAILSPFILSMGPVVLVIGGVGVYLLYLAWLLLT
jgi:hypothetical protein